MTDNIPEPPIRMEQHYYEHVEVSLNKDFSPKEGSTVQFQATIWSSVYKHPEDKSRFILRMLIKIPYPPVPSIPMTASFQGIAVFSVNENYGKSEEDKAALVKATGGGMLYGAMREFILSITARCNWDYRPLYLPTFSLQAIAGAPLLESIQTPSAVEQEKLPTVD